MLNVITQRLIYTRFVFYYLYHNCSTIDFVIDLIISKFSVVVLINLILANY